MKNMVDKINKNNNKIISNQVRFNAVERE